MRTILKILGKNYNAKDKVQKALLVLAQEIDRMKVKRDVKCWGCVEYSDILEVCLVGEDPETCKFVSKSKLLQIKTIGRGGIE